MTPFLLVALLGAPTPADDLPAPVTLDAALAYARAHAPALRAAAARVDAARASARAAAPWPDARLMISADPLPIETRNGPAWGRLTLTQPLPWLDTLDARRAAAAAAARAADEAVALARLDVDFAARRAYAGLRAARDEARIMRELLDLSRALLRTAEDRLGVDRARHADVIEARIEVARLETVVIDVAQRALTRQAELNAAIGRPTQAPIGPLAPPAETPTAALDALLAEAAEHPALRRNAARLDAARARLRAAETRGRPDFSVGLGYTLIGDPDSPMAPAPGRDALSVQIGVSVPLWRGAADDGERDAAAAAIRVEQAEDAAAGDTIAWRVVEQAVRAETALRRLRLYHDVALPMADERLEVLTVAYGAGEARFERLLDAERMKERYAVATVRAAKEYAVARAALARAVGRAHAVEGEASDE